MAKKKSYISIRSFLTFLSTYKWRFLFVLSFFLVADILLAVIPIFIGKLVGALAVVGSDHGTVYLYTGILIACSAGHDLVWRASEILFMKMIHVRGYAYENLLFKSVVDNDYPYFVDKFSGKISSYIARVGEEFRNFQSNIVYNYANEIVRLPTIALIMLSVNLQTGLVFVFSITAMIITGRFTMKKKIKNEKISADKRSDMNGFITDAIANFINIKSFHKEKTEYGYIVEKQNINIVASVKAYKSGLVFWASMSVFVRWVIWPATILMNLHYFLNGQLNIAQFTTFISTILIFSDYIWGVVWNVSEFFSKFAHIEESYHYLFGDRNVVSEFLQEESQQKHSSPVFEKELVINNLSFSYPNAPDKEVLQDIKIRIAKNQKIGIVGKSGSGKTTLIKLLLGYYDIDSDSFIVDGVPTPSKDLSHLVSYVPQDTVLFHRTITDNIAYGVDEDVSDADIKAAAKRAHAEEFIKTTPDGYGAIVGERGLKLSTGQRQRIAIARAFLRNKPLLILDEATSALDSESEILIQKALEDLWHDKTVIAIAHRLSTLRHMDTIVVMDKGRIVEQGTHTELLANAGIYSKLWAHQSGGMIIED